MPDDGKPSRPLRRPHVVTAGFEETDLARFVTDSYPRVLRTVALICDSTASAEDAVHEALARAWEHRATIEHLDRWVLTVALNQARSRWRKVGRREVSLGEGRGAPLEPAAEWVDLHRAVRSLPRRQREVVALHYFADLPIREVGAVLGITSGGVKHALFRARRSLGTVGLEPEGLEEEAK